MKKKINYLILAIVMFITLTSNVFAAKCAEYPNYDSEVSSILIPAGFEFQCTYVFDSKSSTFKSKKVDDSLNPNKIVLSYGVRGEGTTISPDFAAVGYENGKSYEMISFYDDGEIIEKNLIDADKELYIQNSRFSKNISVTFTPTYGCPQSFTMTSAEDDISYFDFSGDINPKKDTLIKSTAFLVYKLADKTGGTLTNGSYNFSATLNYTELESLNTPSSNKIKKYIDNVYGKEKYLDDYVECDSFLKMACFDTNDPIITDPKEQEGIEKCQQLIGEDTLKLLKTVFTWIEIVAPILVIVLSGVDFAGALLKDDPDALKKAIATFTKRLIIAVILFFIPIIVKFLLDNLNLITGRNSTTCGIK